MKIMSTPDVQLSSLGFSFFPDRRIAIQENAGLEPHPTDEVHAAFMHALASRLDERGIESADILARSTVVKFGYHGEALAQLSKLIERHPITQAVRELGQANMARAAENPPDPNLLNDKTPRVDFSAYGIDPDASLVEVAPVRSQSDMITRLEALFNPIDRLLSDRGAIDAAYDRYTQEVDGWLSRRGFGSSAAPREEIAEQKQHQIKTWERDHGVLSVALEVAKEHDFFTKREFVG